MRLEPYTKRILFRIIMENLYFYRQSKSIDEILLPSDLIVQKRIPRFIVEGIDAMNIGRKKWLYYCLWGFLYRGFQFRFIEYDLVKERNVVSKAVLISKVPEYKFLPKKGVHLCYCATKESEKGNGYYPLLLKYIQYNNKEEMLYMVVKEDNLASIKGIEKAGFKRFALGKKDKDGNFIITKTLT